MIGIRKLQLGKHRSVWCFVQMDTAFSNRLRHLQLQKLHAEDCTSDLYADIGQALLLKAPPVRNLLVDNLAKLVGLSPAWKEAAGNRLLSDLGIKTARVKAKISPLNPFNPYRSMLISDFIQHARPLNQYFRNLESSSERQRIIQRVATELRSMHRAGIYFRDFYFGNILITDDQELYWIDTEVKFYARHPERAQQRFLRKLSFQSQRFQRDGGTDDEWQLFMSIIREQSAPA